VGAGGGASACTSSRANVQDQAGARARRACSSRAGSRPAHAEPRCGARAGALAATLLSAPGAAGRCTRRGCGRRAARARRGVGWPAAGGRWAGGRRRAARPAGPLARPAPAAGMEAGRARGTAMEPLRGAPRPRKGSTQGASATGPGEACRRRGGCVPAKSRRWGRLRASARVRTPQAPALAYLGAAAACADKLPAAALHGVRWHACRWTGLRSLQMTRKECTRPIYRVLG